MKKVPFILFSFSFFLFCAEAQAQKIVDSLRFADRVWSLQKKAVILQYLDLTEAEKSSFWPVYESYYSATQYLEMEYLYLISELSRNYNKGERLGELSEQILQNDLFMARVRKQYYKKFKKALSSAQASAFMQLDNTMRILKRLEAQKEIPAGEITRNSLA